MIVLITPTGARKNQFELCMRWMLRQTYQGNVVWIIVDDAVPLTTDSVLDDFRNNWIINKIYPKPRWTGQNTQGRNIKAGLDAMKALYDMTNVKGIFIIEDDDYYKPTYLERMMEHKKSYWIWGETNTIYYNVTYRKYVVNANKHHASLFQTAFTIEALPHFENNLNHKFIDAGFWAHGPNKYLFFENYLAVGIKGMAGRNGIGAGHQWFRNMHDDIGMKYLTKIIGADDRKQYERYYRDSRVAQYDILTKKRF